MKKVVLVFGYLWLLFALILGHIEIYDRFVISQGVKSLLTETKDM